MEPIEIIVIIACILIVGGVMTTAIINKKNGKTSCGCDCKSCSSCHSCNLKKEENTNKLD